MAKRKTSLLFGNGLNQLSDHPVSWKSLLERIKGSHPFVSDDLPNTMIYERAVLEKPLVDHDVLGNESAVKKDIAEMMGKMPTNEFYGQLFDLGLEHYLTTNYDYAFKKAILERDDAYSDRDLSSEDVYSVRRRTAMMKKGREVCKIWSLHGEIAYPATIMLGLDHYCGSVGKIDAYVKGNYTFQQDKKPVNVHRITEKLKGDATWDGHSWVELVFNTNMHILGLSLDYSEIDLWWILNRRARIMKSRDKGFELNNEVFYYSTSIEPEKRDLLKAMNVEVVEAPKPTSKVEWEQYYRGVIKQIEHKAR